MRVISFLFLFFLVSTIAVGCRFGSPHLFIQPVEGDPSGVPEGDPSETPGEGPVAHGPMAFFSVGSSAARSERFVAKGSMTSVALPEARSERFRTTGSSLLMDQQALDERGSQP